MNSLCGSDGVGVRVHVRHPEHSGGESTLSLICFSLNLSVLTENRQASWEEGIQTVDNSKNKHSLFEGKKVNRFISHRKEQTPATELM